jgi:hypothetical protein
MYSRVFSYCSSDSTSFDQKRRPKTWFFRAWRSLKARAYWPFRSRIPSERFASGVSIRRW